MYNAPGEHANKHVTEAERESTRLQWCAHHVAVAQAC